MITKRTKIVKRKPGQKSVLYFDKGTEDAIISFLSSTDKLEREKIYKSSITPALHKLLESLVHVYDFKSPLVNNSELIEDGCCFLYESLHKWKPDHGSKAFSYFNIVAKRFLINTTNSHRKKYTKHVYLDDVDSKNHDISRQLFSMELLPSSEELIIRQESLNAKLEITKRIRNFFSEKDDIIIIDAIDSLFKSAEDLDFINKQSIYIYLIELTGFEKKRITKTIAKIRKLYSKLSKGK